MNIQHKNIWVFVEQREKFFLSVGLELLSEGRKLADKRKCSLSALVLGNGLEKEAEILFDYGADEVIYAENEYLEFYNNDAYAKVIAELALERKPEIILFGATTIGRDLAPKLSIKLNTGLTADCTNLDIDDETGNLLQTRPAFGGNLMATIICPERRPQMSTVRPGVMCKKKFAEKKHGKIEKINYVIKKEELLSEVIKAVKSEHEKINLNAADIIVSGGRGLRGEKGFELIKKLADKLGGVVASSRAAVDSGWINKNCLVGQTGDTVKPKLYIACGISGAMQHVVGMQSADCIVAINTDPNAPIFKIAHYGLVGDVYKIVPEIIKILEKKEE